MQASQAGGCVELGEASRKDTKHQGPVAAPPLCRETTAMLQYIWCAGIGSSAAWRINGRGLVIDRPLPSGLFHVLEAPHPSHGASFTEVVRLVWTGCSAHDVHKGALLVAARIHPLHAPARHCGCGAPPRSIAG